MYIDRNELIEEYRLRMEIRKAIYKINESDVRKLSEEKKKISIQAILEISFRIELEIFSTQKHSILLLSLLDLMMFLMK